MDEGHEQDTVINVGRYRVWCLSWDDDEHDGSIVCVYDIMTHDLNRQEKGVVYASNVSVFDLGDVVEAYADWMHSKREGYEVTWPLEFRVRCPDKSIHDFEVHREHVPKFTAHPITKGAKGTKEDAA